MNFNDLTKTIDAAKRLLEDPSFQYLARNNVSAQAFRRALRDLFEDDLDEAVTPSKRGPLTFRERAERKKLARLTYVKARMESIEFGQKKWGHTYSTPQPIALEAEFNMLRIELEDSTR